MITFDIIDLYQINLKILDPYFQKYTLLHAKRVLLRGEGEVLNFFIDLASHRLRQGHLDKNIGVVFSY